MSKKSQRIWAIACLFYFALLLAIIFAADTGRLPTALLDRIPAYDTLGHFFLYGIGSFLSHRAAGKRLLARGRFAVPLGPFLVGTFAVLEEGSQFWLPDRTASWVDLAASFVGIVLFQALGKFCDRPRSEEHQRTDRRRP